MKKILSAYLELTKPRIVFMILVTTVLGYYLGGKGINSWPVLFYLIIGVSLTCAGASVLNQYLEREYDSKMTRTRNRPIPSGRITADAALTFGIILSLVGLFILYVEVNILTAFLSLLTTFLYVMVYTPMKRVSWLNTTVGSVPGAIPPLGGWAAATGTLDFNAGMLFLILFVWQHPHFYAIAWLCREDYQKCGFQMLSVIDPDGDRMFRHTLFYAAILVPVSIIPVFTGQTGLLYCIGALLVGCAQLWISQLFVKTRTHADAVKLLKASVFYLPTIFILILLDTRF